MAAQQHKQTPIAKPAAFIGQNSEQLAKFRLGRPYGPLADQIKIAPIDQLLPVDAQQSHTFRRTLPFCEQFFHRRRVQKLLGRELLQFCIFVLGRLQLFGV